MSTDEGLQPKEDRCDLKNTIVTHSQSRDQLENRGDKVVEIY